MLLIIDPERLIDRINLISTEEQIVEATMRDNLSLFDRGFSDEELIKVRNFLSLDNIDLDTVINKDLISSGEMQRIY